MMLASFIRRAVSTRPATTLVAPVLSHVAATNANVEFAADAPRVVAAPTAPAEQSSVGNPRTAVLRDEEDLLIASIRRLEAERELARMRRQCEEELGLLRNGLKAREEQVARIVRGKITKAIPKKRSVVAPPHGSAHCVPTALHTSAAPGSGTDALHTGNVPVPHAADLLAMPTAAKLLANASEEEQHQEQGQEQEEQQEQQGEEGREAFPYTVEPPPPNHTESGITIPSPAVPATEETNGEEDDAAVAMPKDRVGSSETVAEGKALTSAAKKRSPRSSSKSNNSKSNSRNSAGAKRNGRKAAEPSNASRARKPVKKPESGKSQGARKTAVKKTDPKRNAVVPSKKAPARAKPAAKRVSAVRKAPQEKKKVIEKPKPNARKTNAIRKK